MERDTANGVSVYLKHVRDLLLGHLENLVHIYDVQSYVIFKILLSSVITAYKILPRGALPEPLLPLVFPLFSDMLRHL